VEKGRAREVTALYRVYYGTPDEAPKVWRGAGNEALMSDRISIGKKKLGSRPGLIRRTHKQH